MKATADEGGPGVPADPAGEELRVTRTWSVWKVASVVANLAFAAWGLSEFDYLYTILLVPVPSGLWVLLPAICFSLVLALHAFEHRPELQISAAGGGVAGRVVRYRERPGKAWREVPVAGDGPAGSTSPHVNAGWGAFYSVQVLVGLLYTSEGVSCLRAGLLPQGALFFAYGLFSLASFLVSWFLPDLEVHLPGAGVGAGGGSGGTIVVPALALGELRGNYSRRQLVAAFPSQGIPRPEPVRPSTGRDWAGTAMVAFPLFTFSLAFFGRVYTHQFVDVGSLLLAAVLLRRFISSGGTARSRARGVGPSEWLLWAFLLNELGWKCAYLTTLGLLAPSYASPWTVLAWTTYALLIAALVVRVELPLRSRHEGTRRGLVVVAATLVGALAWNVLATLQVLPFHLAVAGFPMPV
ncbi:MAG: hypothetical protein ACTSU5_00060 [Promethearchaeota archaeon]